MAHSNSNIFRFKNFSLTQGRTAMRINTDGVLLAAWVGFSNIGADREGAYPLRVLDVGTGCGVIAAIVAQRLAANRALYSLAKEQHEQGMPDKVGTFVEISALEPHRGSFEDASENFAALSPLLPNISLSAQNCTLLEWMEHCAAGGECAGGYNLIISNPPYFTNSLKSAHTIKNSVRHSDSLPQGQLILAAERLLAPSGRLALILPDNEAQEFIRKVSLIDELHLARLCTVRTTPSKPVKRYMMEFARGTAQHGNSAVEENLVIQDQNGYTEEYRALTGGLYINI